MGREAARQAGRRWPQGLKTVVGLTQASQAASWALPLLHLAQNEPIS